MCLLLFFFFPFQNEYYYEAKIPVYKFPEDDRSSLVMCFSLMLLPALPFKIDVTLEYLVIAEEVRELGVMWRLWKEHCVGDTSLPVLGPIYSNSVLTCFNSMWTVAIHLVIIFRGGKKLANMLGVQKMKTCHFSLSDSVAYVLIFLESRLVVDSLCHCLWK